MDDRFDKENIEAETRYPRREGVDGHTRYPVREERRPLRFSSEHQYRAARTEDRCGKRYDSIRTADSRKKGRIFAEFL